MTQVFQINYDIYQQAGWPGQQARPGEPYAYDTGVLHVPAAATRNPRPGDAVYWDETENAYAIPTTAAEVSSVVGLISYDASTLQSSLSAVPSGANSDAFIEYKDGAVVKVAVMGTFYAQAGSAMEYGEMIDWDTADFLWDPRTQAGEIGSGVSTVTALRTAVNSLISGLARLPIVCVSPEPVAANGVAEVRLGWGRVV